MSDKTVFTVTLNTITNETVPLPVTFGASSILVSHVNHDASAIFHVVANPDRGATIFCPCSVPGRYGEHLSIKWNNTDEHPIIKYEAKPDFTETGEHVEEQTFRVAQNKTN